MKAEILEILFKHRIDFSDSCRYTDFGIRECEFDKIADEIELLINGDPNVIDIQEEINHNKVTTETDIWYYSDMSFENESTISKNIYTGTLHKVKGEDETLESKPFKIRLVESDEKVFTYELLLGDLTKSEVKILIQTFS